MTLFLEGRRFVEDDRVLSFREDREGIVTASWSSPHVAAGALTGRRDDAELTFGFSQIERSGLVTAGDGSARLERLPDGRLRLHETWHVAGATGHSVLEELPGTRWVRTRVAVPTRSMPDALAFWVDLLGLPVDGPHPATPYDLAFVALPGGTQLEITAGGVDPVEGSADDLIVLYVPTAADVTLLHDRLVRAGVPLLASSNPYWDDNGVTVRDPDGRLVVLAHLPA